MDIQIGRGLDQYIFGLKESDVIQLLGNPDKISTEERDNRIVYYYNNVRSKFFFDIESDDKLISIETSNPNVYLFGKKIIGMHSAEIEELLNANGISVTEYESCWSFDDIFCEEIWMLFTFCYDRLKELEFSILNDEEDCLVWPEI